MDLKNFTHALAVKNKTKKIQMMYIGNSFRNCFFCKLRDSSEVFIFYFCQKIIVLELLCFQLLVRALSLKNFSCFLRAVKYVIFAVPLPPLFWKELFNNSIHF